MLRAQAAPFASHAQRRAYDITLSDTSRMMVIHKPAWPTISVPLGYQRSAPTRARLHLDQAPQSTVPRHMAIAAEGQAVGLVESQFGVIGIALEDSGQQALSPVFDIAFRSRHAYRHHVSGPPCATPGKPRL